MADLESDIRLALRAVRFNDQGTAIRILERILAPEEEGDGEPEEYPKWLRHPEDERQAFVKDEDHETEIRELWGLPKLESAVVEEPLPPPPRPTLRSAPATPLRKGEELESAKDNL